MGDEKRGDDEIWGDFEFQTGRLVAELYSAAGRSLKLKSEIKSGNIDAARLRLMREHVTTITTLVDALEGLVAEAGDGQQD